MRYYIFFAMLLVLPGCKPTHHAVEDPLKLTWSQIEAKAKGQTVNLLMWTGDPFINKYMNNYVVPNLKKQFGITLKISGAQGNTIVQTLTAEKEAGKTESELDMMWINGETFYQLKQIDALYGPFTNRLPNAQYIDLSNPFVGIDFQNKIDGMECPWGNVQLTIIYDSVRVRTRPYSFNDIVNFVKANPGTFTIPNEFTGMTFLKSWLISIAGKGTLDGKFDEIKYQKYTAELWSKINNMKKYFWKNGETFPENLATMHQMFAAGELNFTMSNNDGEVDNKISQGFFPVTARAYVIEPGTIQNSHYMGIVKNAPNKAAALVVANFLVSPEAQLQKMRPDIWGDGTVLNVNKLPVEWQQKFKNIPGRRYAPVREEIQSKAYPELAPAYMVRIAEDFRKKVIEAH
jgi:putative spermidine/putrescine transport system substrate-binding protein